MCHIYIAVYCFIWTLECVFSHVYGTTYRVCGDVALSVLIYALPDVSDYFSCYTDLFIYFTSAIFSSCSDDL